MKTKKKKENVNEFVKENFLEIVKVLSSMGFMVVKRVGNDVAGVFNCKHCQANLSFARLHDLDVLERVDSFDVVEVCIDK